MFGANELQLNADIIFHEDNAQDSQDNGVLKMNLDSYKAARGLLFIPIAFERICTEGKR
jgi:hypothetical protein